MESNEKVRKVVKKELGIDKKRLVHSFKYAFSGIWFAIKTQRNMAILVIICGFLFHISYLEWLSCLILIALVLMAEMFNTAIEYVVDLASPEIHPLAKAAKDVASAGVLMMAIISAILGLIIFVPKLIEFIGGLL